MRTKHTGMLLSNLDDRKAFGYDQKIKGQISAFLEHGYTMIRVNFRQGWVQAEEYKPDGRVKLLQHGESAGGPIRKRIRLLRFADRTIYCEQPSFLYVRYSPFDFLLIMRLLRWARLPTVQRIYVEIPTYPYDRILLGKSLSLKSFARWSLDFITRQFLRFGCDRLAVVCCKKETIFGIPVLDIRNGIIPPARGPESDAKSIEYTDCIKAVFVGNVGPWHGLDRLIQGMAIYAASSDSGQRKFELTIIGSGQIADLQDMVSRNSLRAQVNFVGPMGGEDLRTTLRSSAIGIGVLGNHRIIKSPTSALKHREYCAEGVPFVHDGKDETFRGTDFSMSVGSNDEPVDIASVIDFAVRAQKNPSLAEKMSAFSRERLTWKKSMQSVFDDLDKVLG